MGSGHTAAVVALVLLGLLLAASSGVGADRLLVEDERHTGVPSVVHVALDAPAQPADLEIVVTIEGPAEDRELATVERVEPGSPERLVALPWTPENVGEHTLRGEVVVGDEVRTLGEREVHVGARPGETGSALPDTAPGTVQWAIAFGFLFFVVRAGFGHRGP